MRVAILTRHPCWMLTFPDGSTEQIVGGDHETIMNLAERLGFRDDTLDPDTRWSDAFVFLTTREGKTVEVKG